MTPGLALPPELLSAPSQSQGRRAHFAYPVAQEFREGKAKQVSGLTALGQPHGPGRAQRSVGRPLFPSCGRPRQDRAQGPGGAEGEAFGAHPIGTAPSSSSAGSRDGRSCWSPTRYFDGPPKLTRVGIDLSRRRVRRDVTSSPAWEPRGHSRSRRRSTSASRLRTVHRVSVRCSA